MGQCPYGREVGDPPRLDECEQRRREGCCGCTKHMQRYAWGLPTDDTVRVVAWWQAYPPEHMWEGVT